MNNQRKLQGITYRGVVNEFTPGCTLYNFGTESRLGERTSEHHRELDKKYQMEYITVSEKEDRFFGNKVIKSGADKIYIRKLRDLLIEKTRNKSICILSERRNIDSHGLSPTECLLVPNDIYNSPIFNECVAEIDTWYYTDKTIRGDIRYSNASTTLYIDLLSDDEKKHACRPISWDKHNKILCELKKLPLKQRLAVKRLCVQSISLAIDYSLLKLFPNLKQITVLCVYDDYENNKDIYNKIKLNKLYNIIELQSDADVEDYYMNECKDFDLVLANPPYSRKITNNIIPEIVQNNQNAIILMLSSLCDSKGKGDPKVRNATEPFLTGIEDLGNFSEEVQFPVSIYSYSKDDVAKITYEKHTLSRYSDVEKAIRDKIKPLPKFERSWMKEDLDRRVKEAHPDWPEKYGVSNCKKLFAEEKQKEGETFIECGVFAAKNGGDGIIMRVPNCYVASYYGPKELIDNFKNPIYKYLAFMYSTNKRDQQVATISELPLQLPEFTAEELMFLENNYNNNQL